MWKSVIRNCPDPDFDPNQGVLTEAYKDWLQKIEKEPLIRGFQELAEPTGWWVGTEEELIEELKARGSGSIAVVEIS